MDNYKEFNLSDEFLADQMFNYIKPEMDALIHKLNTMANEEDVAATVGTILRAYADVNVVNKEVFYACCAMTILHVGTLTEEDL